MPDAEEPHDDDHDHTLAYLGLSAIAGAFLGGGFVLGRWVLYPWLHSRGWW